MTDTCATCFFGQTFASVANATNVRLCRRNPPVPGLGGSLGGGAMFWPPVKDSDWCGLGVDDSTGNPFAPVAPAAPPFTTYVPTITASPGFSNATAVIYYTEDTTQIVSFQGSLDIIVNGFAITSCTLSLPVAPRIHPPQKDITISASFTPPGGATTPCDGTVVVKDANLSLVGFSDVDGTVVTFNGSYRGAA